MNLRKLTRAALAFLLAAVMLLSAVACTPGAGPDDTTAAPTDTVTPDESTSDESTSEESTASPAPDDDVIDEHTYDFYITLGTMPTLYATLNAYARQNPNTYMWFCAVTPSAVSIPLISSTTSTPRARPTPTAPWIGR